MITGVEQTEVGARIELTLSDGKLGCTVTERMQTDGSKEKRPLRSPCSGWRRLSPSWREGEAL